MKVLLLSYMDSTGAGKAILKLKFGLDKYRIKNELWVIKKSSILSKQVKMSFFQKIYMMFIPRLNRLAQKLQISINNKIYEVKINNYKSIDFFNINLTNLINNSDFDLVQINWINNFLSVEQIAQIKKPLVWRLSDMWPICGAEHYVHTNDQRWRTGYLKKNDSIIGIDWDKWMWEKKKKFWKKPIQIITPSKWLKKCVKKSYLLNKWPVNQISTPIDFETFYHREKKRDDFFNILYGASFYDEERKGYDFFERIYNKFSSNKKIKFYIFGSSKYKILINKNIEYLGNIKSDKIMSQIYNKADVFLLPSYIDNLPQTGLEAQSCGLPIVAFNISGISELIVHKKTGYLAKPFDFDDLSKGIVWALNKKFSRRFISNLAKKKYSISNTIPKYLDIYRKVIKNELNNKNF